MVTLSLMQLSFDHSYVGEVQTNERPVYSFIDQSDCRNKHVVEISISCQVIMRVKNSIKSTGTKFLEQSFNL